MTIDTEADSVVAEMMRLGASFEVLPSGPNGESRWFYNSRASHRSEIRRFKAAVELTKPGMQAAMIRAIARAKKAGAP